MAIGALDGRRILITGAAAGIGLATAELFARSGATLALFDRNEDGVHAAGERLGAFSGACDVSSPTDVEAAVEAAEQALGGLDGVVNAAGLLRTGAFVDAPLDVWHAMLAVNLTGTMLVCRAATPALHRAGKATIVNIASIGGLQPARSFSAYSVSKAGVVMLSKCLALELGPEIRVNSVSPGTIETAMIADLLGNNATRDRLTTSAALQRVGAPSDIADALLYLTSDQSGYVNGANLTVDGGYSFR